MMGWPAQRLLGVFPANSWLTPRQLGRERIPQPRQPPGAGAAGRDHGSAQRAHHPAGRPGPRGSGGTGARHDSHRASSLLPPRAHGNRQHGRACGHILHPCSAKDGTDAGQAGHCLMARAGDAPWPGKGLSPWHEGQDSASFPMLAGSRETPTNALLCSFCFPLRLFIGNF